MGEITKLRPHGYRTETEAWNEDTKTIEEVEKEIKKGITDDNYFTLFCKINWVAERCTLTHDKKYMERHSYCQKLISKLRGEK